MKKNTITFYVSDDDKEVYKNFKQKAKQDNRSVSEMLVALMKQELGE